MLAPLTPGFIVLQGNQLEDLRDVAVQWLKANPLRPLENECVLVQSNGIAQWLKMSLAQNEQHAGIAAAIDVQLPGRFIWQAFRSLFTQLPASSPFDKNALTWRIYQLLRDWPALERSLGGQIEQLAPLRGFLAADNDPRRCYQLAGKLADLYDQYQLYRADWLQAWEEGQDVLINARGQTLPLPEQQRWQAIVWRSLSSSIRAGREQDWSSASRAHIHQEFIRACAGFSPENRPQNLPRRVIVFSISSLPQQTLQLLQAISPFTQVMIFATNPCQHYWGDLVEGKELLRREYQRIAERKTPASLAAEELHIHGHPLLASWGKQGRDFLHLLDEHDQPDNYRHLFNQQKIDLFTDPGQGCLLHQLQSDILHLRPLHERQAMQSKIDCRHDQSLQFLIAHSPQREVEILHDQLLASFAEAKARGQTLNPRDILVMVPDIDLYTPHIHAVFGRYAGDRATQTPNQPAYLPYHICDQSIRKQNTLLLALEKLLHLPQLRFSVSELSDLLDTPALLNRFGLEEKDLPLLRRWIHGANIRWGLDAQQRKTLGLPELEQNTWLSGIQRMLLGYAVGDSGSWQGIEPYDEVAGLDAALLGPLVQLLDSLKQAGIRLAQEHNASDWPLLIEQLVQEFFCATGSADNWALSQLELQLESLHNLWHENGLDNEALPLEVVREELLSGLEQPSLSQKFLGGSINFATLMPMRAIPFSQLWLLGMNVQDYPRSRHSSDFDLMANDYRPGDRSRREDDRYLFLEALLCARQRLVISWVGKDIRDNSERPPSVLVSQLRDHLAAGWQSDNDEDLLARLTVEHPLQPFSTSYFRADSDPRLFTYANHWRQVHEQAGFSQTRAEDLDTLPPWQPLAPVRLNQLASFLRNPVQHFYQQRLGIGWLDEIEQSLDHETFALDGLQTWTLHDQLIRNCLHQLTLEPQQDSTQLLTQQIERLRRSGALPMQAFAQASSASLHEQLEQPLASYQQLLLQYPQRLPAQLFQVQQDDLLLADALADIRCNQQHQHICLVLQPSMLRSRDAEPRFYHLVRHWPAHLCAQLEHSVTTYVLGPASQVVLPAITADTARKLIEDLLQAYWQGLQRPLPVPCKTAFAELNKAGSGAQTYEGGYNSSAEMQDNPWLARLWPDFASLQQDGLFTRMQQLIYKPLYEFIKQND